MELHSDFKARAARAAGDPEVIAKFWRVAERFAALRKFRLANQAGYEELRASLSRAKLEVLDRHDHYLALVREQVEQRGGKVHFAADARAAREIIVRIAGEAGCRLAVKGKSMTSEEIGLSPELERAGLEVLETDLGEYIIQLAGETPSHIVTPAIHKNRFDVARLFADKLGMEYTDDPTALTMKAREVLRQKFLAADLGITGANALIAETGTVALLENEGNIRLSTTQPRVHVALAGIEKILPRMSDLPGFLRLLPLSATGQKISGYVSLLAGPARNGERDGPREFHLVLLDNGRSRMRGDPVMREALKCIRCGACLNICPVYQHIGGHAYGSVYPGPIGAMITEALAAGSEGRELPFASTLCGACAEVCPAKVPITRVLIGLRERAAGSRSFGERLAFRAWSGLWSRPAGFRLTTRAGAVLGKFGFEGEMLESIPGPGRAWTQERDFPAPSPRSFSARWPELARELQQERNRPRPTCPERREKKPDPALPSPPSPLEAFLLQAATMRIELHRVAGRGELAQTLAAILRPFAGQGMVAWDHPDLDELGLAGIAGEAGVNLIPLAADLDQETFKQLVARAAVGVTLADYGLGESGSLALVTAPGRERSLSLLPPVHVAILRESSILPSIDSLLPAVTRDFGGDFGSITLISGPSMTGDIEMMPVFGVHGPGRLVVIILE